MQCPISAQGRLVDAAVSRHAESWAKKTGLTPSDARFQPFRVEVTKALYRSIEAHINEQDPFFKAMVRTADWRERLEDEAKLARSLAQLLRDFTRKYRHGNLVVRPGRLFDLASPAQDLDALASHLDEIAGDLKDKGGPTPRFRAFKVLATGLMRAKSGARKRAKGGTTRKRAARDGRLLKLVDAVVPTAIEIAKETTGKPLATPSHSNVGDHLRERANPDNPTKKSLS